jgi:uncharacterized protein YcbX
MGLENDRRWMVVRDNGTFVTAREIPKMVLITPRLEDEGASARLSRCACAALLRGASAEGNTGELILDAPDMPRLRVPLEPPKEQSRTMECKIWSDTVPLAVYADLNVTKWFSIYLGVDA